MEQVTAVVDFGTSHTVVVVSGPGMPARLVPVDGEPWFPSAVFWDRDGRAVIGREAQGLGWAEPARLERRPKARLGEGEVLLGDTVVPAVTLVRNVLVRAVAEVVSKTRGVVGHLVLTHPADWGATRLGSLLTAAQGLVPRVSTVPEPVAAAAWFAAARSLPVGALLAVLDFGGGTCDAALVRRDAGGLEVAACAGLPDLGGDDLDQRIVDHLVARHPALRDWLAGEHSRADFDRFRDEVRAAKEALSHHPQAEVALPAGLPDALLTRTEFEDLVRADLARAVELLDSTVRTAGHTPAELAAVQLVGGSSRVPLLANLIRAWTNGPVQLDDQPEAVVALGAEATLRSTPAAPKRTEQARDPAHPTVAAPPVPQRRRTARVAAIITAVAAVVAVAAGTAYLAGFRLGGAVTGAASGPGPSLVLPAATAGDPVTVPGRATDSLPEAEPGQYVDYVYQSTPVQWRFDSFDDDAGLNRTLANLGNEVRDGYHWAMVRYSVKTRAPAAAEPDVNNQVYLVDDRGLMISPSTSFNSPARSDQVVLPEDCPDLTTTAAAAGAEFARCAVYAVPDGTPITEVAVAYHANAHPIPSLDEATRTRGARVAVTGRDPSGKPPVFEAHQPGARVAMNDNQLAADIAVIGVVDDASEYLDDSTTPILGGSTAMVLRVAVHPTEPTPADDLIGVSAALLDERGAPIDPSVAVKTNECVDMGTSADVSGTVARCILFAVPTGATPTTAVVRIGVGENQIWHLPST